MKRLWAVNPMSGDRLGQHSRMEHRLRQGELHPQLGVRCARLVPLPVKDNFQAGEGHMDDSAYGKSQLLWQLRDKVPP